MEKIEVHMPTQRRAHSEEAELLERHITAANDLNVVESSKGKKRWLIPEEVWAARKNEIQELYMTKNHTLGTTMDIMKERGFSASTKLYKDKLRFWGFSKYVKKDDLHKPVRRTKDKDNFFPLSLDQSRRNSGYSVPATDESGRGDSDSCAGFSYRHWNQSPYIADGTVSPRRRFSHNPTSRDEAAFPSAADNSRSSIGDLLFPTLGRGIAYGEDFVKLKNEGTDLLHHGLYNEAVSKLEAALSGPRGPWFTWADTDPCVVEAAWGLAYAYTKVDGLKASEVLNHLSAAYCREFGLWHPKSVLHYTRIIEALQIDGRHGDAKSLGLQLYKAAKSKADPTSEVLLRKGGPEEDEPQGLGMDLFDWVYRSSRGDEEARANQQLMLTKLWCTAGLAGMDYVVRQAASSLEYCRPERATDVRYLLLRLRIAMQEHDGATAECKAARDSMAKRILDPNTTHLPVLLRQCRELSKLHLLNKDMEGYYIALNWTADNLEKVILSPARIESRQENIRLLVDYLAQTGIDCYQHLGWGWSKAKLWFERAYVVAVTKLGAKDTRSLELERERALQCYTRERSLV